MSILKTLNQRYSNLAHAMQSGVALMMNYNPKETEPKHLRVGINSSMVNDAAIAALLIKKGIFTLEEYTKAVCIEMEKEVELYQSRIQEHLGTETPIVLK